MPRVPLTPVNIPSAYAYAAANVTDAFEAGDASEGNEYAFTGREVVLVRNTDPSAPFDVTVKGQPGGVTARTKDTVVAVDPGDTVVLPFVKADGWEIGGVVQIDVEDAALELAVLRLP